jgi:hypothetical protein
MLQSSLCSINGSKALYFSKAIHVPLADPCLKSDPRVYARLRKLKHPSLFSASSLLLTHAYKKVKGHNSTSLHYFSRAYKACTRCYSWTLVRYFSHMLTSPRTKSNGPQLNICRYFSYILETNYKKERASQIYIYILASFFFLLSPLIFYIYLTIYLIQKIL